MIVRNREILPTYHAHLPRPEALPPQKPKIVLPWEGTIRGARNVEICGKKRFLLPRVFGRWPLFGVGESSFVLFWYRLKNRDREVVFGWSLVLQI